MVTVKKKSPPQPVRQTAAQLRRANGEPTKRATKASAAGHDEVADLSFTEHADPASSASKPAFAGDNRSNSLVARGKDMISEDAGGVATAAAIVVGAALIEIELIPGLIIGAGAILLGKFFPEMSGYVRPAVKSVVRAGFSATQKMREVMAEASEQVHDLVAEVKQEQEQALNVKKGHVSDKARVAAGDSPVY